MHERPTEARTRPAADRDPFAARRGRRRRRPGACWARRRTCRRSRPAARSTRSTSAATCSASARSSCDDPDRQAAVLVLPTDAIRIDGDSRRDRRTPSRGWTRAGPTRSWSRWQAVPGDEAGRPATRRGRGREGGDGPPGRGRGAGARAELDRVRSRGAGKGRCRSSSRPNMARTLAASVLGLVALAGLGHRRSLLAAGRTGEGDGGIGQTDAEAAHDAENACGSDWSESSTAVRCKRPTRSGGTTMSARPSPCSTAPVPIGAAGSTATSTDCATRTYLQSTGMRPSSQCRRGARTGQRVVTAGFDNMAKVWDARTGAEQFTLRGHTDTVFMASFSADGSWIVTGSWDKTAKVWDAKTGVASPHARRAHGIRSTRRRSARTVRGS